ncbi:hypothetical protein [Streptomyces parvulus]|uniref:hypothetical protein n=1 Tax=Streptomyces parvulus TaxID=146923 RepID=UPI0036FD8429
MTWAWRATRRAKTTMAVTVPATTPMARLCVATTTATVSTMTVISPAGIRRRVFGETECQSKVPNATMTMTATRAAMGIERAATEQVEKLRVQLRRAEDFAATLRGRLPESAPPA